MKRILLAICHAAALLSAPAASDMTIRIDLVKSSAIEQQNQHSSLRRSESNARMDQTDHPNRDLLDLLRYVPMDFGLSLETSQSGDIDTDELSTILGDHVLGYLQQAIVEYEAVSVETEVSTVSEPFRRLEEMQLMILQVRVTGFVYFLGDSLPTSEYLNEAIKGAFEGDEMNTLIANLEVADDSVLRATTSVWSSLTDSKEQHLAIQTNSSSIGDIIMDNIVYISAGLASGVTLIALFAGLHYRRSKQEDQDDLGLTEIPWLSVQVPKRAPKRGDSDIESMEAPIEAIVGETTSVMINVVGQKPEKIALKDDISVIPKLSMPAEDKAALLTQLYERSLCDGGIFERKSVSFDDEMSDVIGCDVIGAKLGESSAENKHTPQVLAKRPTTPETVRDQGQEIDINYTPSEDKSKRSMFSSKFKKKVSIKKKVSFPSLKKANRLKKSKSKKSKRAQQKTDYLDAIEEGDEVSLAKESRPIPLAYLANEIEETNQHSARYEMAGNEGGIFSAISNKDSGIMDAWDHISRKFSADPNWDTNTSVSSRDFENTSFQCLGPACVSTMSESHATNENSTTDDASDEMTDFSETEYMTQYTESEHMSQFTNPSTNASLSTGSYSYESESTFSDESY